MTAYEAVVVGGGPNGLAAALRLAEAGWSVCLLEANEEVGGGARTLECTIPGFRHDFGAEFLPLVPTAPAIAGRDLGAWGLRLLHAPLPAAHPFPGGEAIALGRSAVATAASIKNLHAGDADAWIRLDEDFGDVVELFLRAQMVRWPVREAAGLLRRLGGAQPALGFVRTLLQGASVVADRFESEQARAFLVAPAMHADLSPDAPGSGIYALLLNLLGERNGMPVAEGGTGAVSAAMAAKLLACGGEILTGRRVDRIVVEGGRAVAAEAGGEAFSARRALIAAVAPELMVAMAGPESFPAGALEQLRGFRRGLGTFKVDWALDGPVPWMAEECRQAAVIHVGDTVRAIGRAAWEAANGLLPAWPTLILGQPTLADPSRAPAGKHVLWGYAHVPTDLAGDALRPRAKAAWPRSTESFLDRIELAIEAHAPGFRELVLARKAWTPQALESADGNLLGGDIINGSFAIDQQLVFRPGPAWWRWGTPVKGLYLASAAVPPGGGVHGACGDLAAAQAIADQRRPALLLAGAALGAAAAGAGLLRSRGRRR
jgi:phytoene dehydrogenase-like protein